MKKTFLKLIPLIAILLGGCTPKIDTSHYSSNNTSSENTSVSSSSNETHSSSEEQGSSSEEQGSSSENQDSSSQEQQSSEEGGDKDPINIDIWATNDIHGQFRDSNEDTTHAGIDHLFTYLKGKRENPNTLLLDQGDTWQGSIYSNYNYGNLINDCMNYIHYDARTVGNHDFDWGAEKLAANTARGYNGYTMPVLSGNVYNYNFDTKTMGTTFLSDLGRKSVTYTLDNGLKVGILGGIGEDQITSICTEYVRDIGFKNHVEFIKEEATHLRNDEKCDVIIASIHAPQNLIYEKGLNNYVDLVLCGHSHNQETYVENDRLLYSQGLAYTESVAHIIMTYDPNVKKVTGSTASFIPANQIISETPTIDPTIQSLITTYGEQCDAAANQVLANNVSGSFYTSNLANLVTKAIYSQCVKEGYGDILCAVSNSARKQIDAKSTWTFKDVYTSFPFDNVVYIAEITGREFRYNIITGYNYITRNPNLKASCPSCGEEIAFNELTSEEVITCPHCHEDQEKDTLVSLASQIDLNKTYKIAVLDYVYLHCNSSRSYDKFTETGGTSTIKLSKNYREIARDWLIAEGYNTGKALRYQDFAATLWQHNKSGYTVIS
ncbi:MAG: bifunctional metallophosphatase/5'-nucleotidase [Bacilli bacterium]|nr:bifunctional metallophosphatase/5'-nucleotidase [Bacilli bacterium]